MNKLLKSTLKIVTIGGGTGHFSLLSALKKIENIEITAIVSMADNGGSTGILRDKMGALPAGDILKALLALSSLPNEFIRPFLLNRFTAQNPAFIGHNTGNLLLTLFHLYSGSFLEAINALSEVLNITGKVLPITVGNITLHALLENKQEIIGETNIDIPKHDPSLAIKKVWLEPNSVILSEAQNAILHADYIIISPGDFWTSIIPVLLVKGTKEAFTKSSAHKIFICSLMTKNGETNDYTLIDFCQHLKEYLGEYCHTILFNNNPLDKTSIQKYQEEKSIPIALGNFKPFTEIIELISIDLLENTGLIRHDVKKLKNVLQTIFFKNK